MSEGIGASGGESIGSRQKASDVMRDAADVLERRARQWRVLADALDAQNAHPRAFDGDGGPYIGVGSGAEILLWELALEARRGA